MKQQLFTMAEGHFYALVNHIVSHLEPRVNDVAFHNGQRQNGQAEPMIVGGLAVQLHIMDMTIKAGLSPECSHFRKTDDIDLDFPSSVSKEHIRLAVEGLPPLETEVGGKLVLAEIVRVGEVKPIIKLTIVSNGSEIEEEVKLNISAGPQDLYGFNNGYHTDRYARKVTISFPHVSVEEQATFSVVSLEDLIVTKAANGREKDAKDLSSIAQVVKTTKRELDVGLMEDSLRLVKDPAKRGEARKRYQEFLARIGKNGKKAPRKPLRRRVNSV